jgi:hypothetical protein
LNELAAKEEAFQEANKLKHQFRALDEDEIDFLDSVLESTRAEEDRIKRETAEGLELFRQQQDEADKKARAGDIVSGEASPTAAEQQWVAGARKRKRMKEKEGIKGVKALRSSSTTERRSSVPEATSSKADSLGGISAGVKKNTDQMDTSKKGPITGNKEIPAASKISASQEGVESSKITSTKNAVGLVDYGSDGSDDW